jgi:uncharacterized protein (TIGR03435 family)
VAGGPSWLELNRYDVTALAPPDTSPATLREMLKALLVERFGLSARNDSTTRDGFALKAGGDRSAFKAASAPGACGGQVMPEPSGFLAMNMTCRGMSMAMLADQLPRMAGQYFPGTQPVIDETGITGLWDFQLKWTPIALLKTAGSEGIPMALALERLGLKLEPRQVTVAALVVDKVAEQPTPDPPDAATRLPPLPTPRFEVASVRPSAPDADAFRFQLQPNGQVNASGMPLGTLIRLAWDMQGDFVVGPEWLNSTRFDIVARASAETVVNAQVDTDMLRVMLQPLLVERFQMKYHIEERPMIAYRLTLNGKPKMTQANPANRAKCIRGLAGTGDRGISQLASLYTCSNVTMAQLGQLLPQYARDYTPFPVIDATGLTGGWDFVLSFTPAGAVQAARTQGAGGGVAIDPTAALTLGEAIERQLGLKLQEEKRRLPVLVIDSISQTPAEN